MNKVSIIIPVYNQLKMTIDCLRGLLNTTEVETEIIVVNDGSEEPVSHAIKKMFPDVNVLTNEKNLGFAKTVNRGIYASRKYNYICLLNNDTILHNPRWLKIMIDNMEENNLDLTGPVGGEMDANWNYIGEVKSKEEPFQYIPGWCLLIKREVYDDIGPMSDKFGIGFWEDVLYSYIAKKEGFRLGITENTGVEHLYHKTFKAAGYDLAKEYKEKRKIFLDIINKKKFPEYLSWGYKFFQLNELTEAVRAEDFKKIDKLISEGVDIRCCDDWVFHYACLRGKIKLVRYLETKGVDISLLHKERRKSTLEWTKKYKQTEILDIIK